MADARRLNWPAFPRNEKTEIEGEGAGPSAARGLSYHRLAG